MTNDLLFMTYDIILMTNYWLYTSLSYLRQHVRAPARTARAHLYRPLVRYPR